MADDAFRITTVPTVDLCSRLDCVVEADHLDGALAEAGYVRLDHGLAPAANIAIMQCDPPAGRDPGHRGPALALAHCLFHVIHADGKPERSRLISAGRLAVGTVRTDPVGERLVAALAAYSATRDPGPRPLPIQGAFGIAPPALATVVYEVARNRNVVTDVALERAALVGDGLEGWESMLAANIRAEEPVVRARRHDAADYEMIGFDPQIAELIAWIRANPDVGTEEFVRYTQMVGVEPREAAQRIENALTGRIALADRSGEAGY